MEKRRAHYNLEEIKAAFSSADQFGNITGVAQKGARELGWSKDDMVAVIQSLTASDLNKSMTSYNDHRVWQDVYWPTHKGVRLYVKFTQTAGQYWLVSFKRNEQ